MFSSNFLTVLMVFSWNLFFNDNNMGDFSLQFESVKPLTDLSGYCYSNYFFPQSKTFQDFSK